MGNTNLIIAGWLFIFVFTGLVFLRWWQGKNHLATYWNMFIAGSVNFIGFGMIQNALGLTAAGDLQRGFFDAESTYYISGTFLFYGVACWIYYRGTRKPARTPYPKQWWPADTPRAMYMVATLLTFVGFVFSILPAFPGVQIFYVAKGPIAVASFCIAIFVVFRNPTSPFGWLLAVFTFGASLVVVLSQGGGRRELLAVFACLPIAAYWAVFRHRGKGKTLSGLAVLSLVGLLVISSYATIRHTDRGSGATGTQRATTRIAKLPSAVIEKVQNISVFGEQGSFIDAQNGVWAGMLAIRFTHLDQNVECDWFHCLKFIVVNPIPRAMWPDKPQGLGKILPELMGQPQITWGPTITGHGFYDGGFFVLVIYALLIGSGFRYLDRRMASDPENPWQIAIMASVVGHVIGLSRGDCGTFVVNILWGIIFVGGITRATLALLPRRDSPALIH